MRFMFGTIDLTSRITLAFAVASKDSSRRVKMVFSFGFCTGKGISKVVEQVRGKRDGLPLLLVLLLLLGMLPLVPEQQMLLA